MSSPVLLALILLAPQRDARADLARELAGAVDLPDPAARRSAAFALAARKDLSIEDLLAAAASFGDFERAEPGSRVERIPILVDGKAEDTELHLRIPKGYDPARAAPLMLSFHWTGGSGEGMDRLWGAVADQLGMLVLAPSEAGANEGYAFSARERAAALAALRWMRRRYDVDENRIFATGISRGGHLAWDLALRHPDLFAAIAPMIGGPRFQLAGGQNNLRYLDNVLHLPIRDLQGSQDDPGLIANLRIAFDRLERKRAADAKLVLFPDKGHDFDFGAVDWALFLGGARRDPAPARVVRLAVRADEARAFWIEVTRFQKTVAEDVTPSVPKSKWDALDEDGRRRLLEEEVEKRTARIEARRTATGRFAVTSERVAAFRLLLPREAFDPASAVRVNFNGHYFEKKAVLDPKVLLLDFVERFDRTFLPVASIEVP